MDHTVVVVGDMIAAVGPTKSVKIPAGAEVVDLAGKAVNRSGIWCSRMG
jgi:imidazolonepropionase-like amidohydrolase